MTVTTTAIGPKQAAEMVGRSKGTIIKAIRNGRISGKKDENGEWRIEPSELLRVYKPANTDTLTDTPQVNNATHRGLQVEIEHLRELVRRADDRAASEAARADDLAKRLDQEGQERRQLMALLTDQRTHQSRKSIWAKLWER